MKKFMLLWLATLFLLQGAVYAQPKSTVWTQEEKVEYEQEVDMLTAFGVTDGTFHNIDDVVSRGEFAHYIVKLMRWDQITPTNDYNFMDISADTPYINSITTAISMGFMHGNGDGTFRPSEPILQGQALRVMIDLLGYGRAANQEGGYPVGYLATASRLQLLENIELTYPMVYGEFTNFLVKCLEVDLMEKVEADSYEICEGVTLLNKHLKLNKKQGVITADSFTAIDSSYAREGGICLDGHFYYYDKPTDNLVGYSVEYYTDEQDETIVYLCAAGVKNKELIVDAEDIIGLSEKTFRYYEGDRERMAQLEKSLYAVYNSEALAQYSQEDFIPAYGDVRLLDNDGDGVYDIAFIRDIKYVIVGSVNSVNQVIYDKEDAEKTVYFHEAQRVMITEGNSNVQNFSGIRPYDVLAVEKSCSGENLRIQITRSPISGAVSALEDTGDALTITVNGTAYEVLKDIAKMPMVGRIYTFYVNEKNQVVYFEESVSETVAYLIDAKPEKAGIFSKIQLKILNNKGKFEYPLLASRVEIDGIPYKGAGVLEPLKKGGSEVLSQVITFAKNSEGEIVKINTPYNYVSDTSIDYKTILPVKEEESSFRMLYSALRGSDIGKNISYADYSYIFGGKIQVDEETIFFVIPDDVKEAAETEFRVSNRGILWGGEEYTAELFTTNANYAHSDVVTIKSTGSIAQAVEIYGLVSDIKQVINEEGHAVYRVMLHSYDYVGEKELYTVSLQAPAERDSGDENAKTREISKGDMVKVISNASNEIESCTILYDGDKKENLCLVNPSASDYRQRHRILSGGVYDVQEGCLLITPENNITENAEPVDGEIWENIPTNSNFRAYRCGKRGGKDTVESITANDFLSMKGAGIDYSRVCVLMDQGIYKIVAIYE